MRVVYSRPAWVNLAAAAIVAALAWCVWVMFGPEDNGNAINVRASSVAAPSSTPQAQPLLAPVEIALPERIIISSIGVDAPVSVKTIGSDGMMQPPDGPEDVAWYDFTAKPGGGGNAVFSGHVDYHDYGAAVFAKVKDLEKGDLIEVRSADGAIYRYQVVASIVYREDEAPVEDIIGATSRETVTLITCTGVFDPSIRQYDERLVVRAERI